MARSIKLRRRRPSAVEASVSKGTTEVFPFGLDKLSAVRHEFERHVYGDFAGNFANRHSFFFVGGFDPYGVNADGDNFPIWQGGLLDAKFVEIAPI